MMHLPPGLHFDVPADRYHADPCEQPSLSSSIAKVLLDQSPRHAWHQHPRLNPEMDAGSDPTRVKEVGSVAHKLILGRGADVVTIDALDFKGKPAREERQRAYLEGKAPILAPDLVTANNIAAAVTAQLAAIEGCEGFASGRPEVVGICRDVTSAHLRCMIDMFEDHGDHAIIWDLKTGDQSAEPTTLGRRIANMSFEVSAAFYERVVLQVRPELAGRLRFRWIFVENEHPHLVTVAELDNAGLEIGRKKVAAAISIWNHCVQAGSWPGYPNHIITAEYPAFAESQWLARELNEEALRNIGMDPMLMRAPWIPPRISKQLSEIAS